MRPLAASVGDNERDLALARAGYLVRRCSGEALRDEQALAREIRAILRERLPPIADARPVAGDCWQVANDL